MTSSSQRTAPTSWSCPRRQPGTRSHARRRARRRGPSHRRHQHGHHPPGRDRRLRRRTRGRAGDGSHGGRRRHLGAAHRRGDARCRTARRPRTGPRHRVFLPEDAPPIRPAHRLLPGPAQPGRPDVDRVDTGQGDVPVRRRDPRQRRPRCRVAASLAKAHCTQHALQAVEDCLQMHGGVGFTPGSTPSTCGSSGLCRAAHPRTARPSPDAPWRAPRDPAPSGFPRHVVEPEHAR